MNPKDSGFIQKYVEKLVLGIAVLCLLGTAYIFVVQDPFPVKVGNKKVGPDQITKTITDAANRLETKINSDETALPDRGIPSYSEAFVADLQEKPTTLAQLTPLAEPGLEELDGPIVKEYNLPHPPIAQDILVRKGHAVLGDNIPTREMEGLIRLVGNHQPRDFAYVSVAGTFDMDEWIERLQSGDKETRVPDRWWNSMIGIAGVMLQRQELNEENRRVGQHHHHRSVARSVGVSARREVHRHDAAGQADDPVDPQQPGNHRPARLPADRGQRPLEPA